MSSSSKFLLGAPDISPSGAIVYSLFIGLAYVLTLYIDPKARIPASPVGSMRDGVDPLTRTRICARIRAALLSTTIIMAVTIAYLCHNALERLQASSDFITPRLEVGKIPSSLISLPPSSPEAVRTSDSFSDIAGTGQGAAGAAIAHSYSLTAPFLGSRALSSAIGLMGLEPSVLLHAQASFYAIRLLAVLFCGPLFTALYVEADTTWPYLLSFQWLNSVLFWRAIVVGPLTEELVFRSCMLPLHLGAYLYSPASVSVSPIFFLIIRPPLLFGIAHINHLIESYTSSSDSSPFYLPVALAVALVQFTYTSVFGAIASFIFLRTRSVVAATVAHAFCNSIGTPAFGTVGRWIFTWDKKGNGEWVWVSKTWWTAVYHILLVIGLVLFVKLAPSLPGDGWI